MLFKQNVIGTRASAMAAAFLVSTVTAAHAGNNTDVPLVIVGIDGTDNNLELDLSSDSFYATDNGYKLRESAMYSDVLNNTSSVELVDMEFDPDPFVLNNIIITNNTAATQSYVVTVLLPTVFGGPNTIAGSITTQAIDGDAVPGATIAAPAGGSIYSALIDGSTVHTLQDDPFSITAPTGGVTNALASFGFIGNALPVTSDIGITLRFTLTAGDSASILSRFDVIPTPASSTLLALSSIAVIRRRRR